MKLRELLQIMQEVQTKIGASTPYICGGTPRDRFLGRLDNISDLDITTGDNSVDYISQELYAALNKKYNVQRKTMDDGHSSIYIGKLKLDFSSNFNVPNIDNYLSEKGITKPTNMQKEMYSRDFTCNALLLTLDLKTVLDPTNNGINDIKNKKIKTCLDPEVTLTSNRNRVVRSIYLACKLGFDIDESIINFVKNNPESVKISSPKSVVEKLNYAFKADPEKASDLLDKMGLWNYVPIVEAAYPYYKKWAGQNVK